MLYRMGVRGAGSGVAALQVARFQAFFGLILIVLRTVGGFLCIRTACVSQPCFTCNKTASCTRCVHVCNARCCALNSTALVMTYANAA
jgi:hypothetical protein